VSFLRRAPWFAVPLGVFLLTRVVGALLIVLVARDQIPASALPPHMPMPTLVDPASYLHAFTVFCTADFVDRLHQIQVPTLVVTGEQDVAATPRMARLMAERIKQSEVHVLAGLRHSVVIEAGEQVTGLLETFL